MNILIAPCVYLLTGFARGHYTRHKFAIKLARVTTGKNCVGGISFQFHSKAGIRYIDLVLWKIRPWIARIKKKVANRAAVEPTRPW